MDVTSELIVGIAGIVLSLLFSYIPGLRVWYAGLVSEKKQILMLGLIALVTIGIGIVGCLGFIATGISCDKAGIIALVKMFFAGIIANQATYLISPATNDAVIAKQLRDDGEKFASEPE